MMITADLFWSGGAVFRGRPSEFSDAREDGNWAQVRTVCRRTKINAPMQRRAIVMYHANPSRLRRNHSALNNPIIRIKLIGMSQRSIVTRSEYGVRRYVKSSSNDCASAGV